MLGEMVIDGIEVSDEPAPRDHAAELLALVASRDQDAFARIECEPLAAIERSVQVLVIGRAAYPPPPPPPEPVGGR